MHENSFILNEVSRLVKYLIIWKQLESAEVDHNNVHYRITTLLINSRLMKVTEYNKVSLFVLSVWYPV